MQPLPDSAAEKEGPFLSLPGELRNLIYTFILDRPHTHDNNKDKRFAVGASCMNLLLLCRQIRAEALPLFKELDICLPWHRAPAVVGAIGFSSFKLVAQTGAKLLLEINGQYKDPVDVLPLIKLRLRTPKLRIDFKFTGMRACKIDNWKWDLDILLGDETSSDLQDRRKFWVLRDLSRILLSEHGRNALHFDVKVRKAYKQDWMSDPAPLDWEMGRNAGLECAYEFRPSLSWKRELGWDAFIYIKSVQVE